MQRPTAAASPGEVAEKVLFHPGDRRDNQPIAEQMVRLAVSGGEGIAFGQSHEAGRLASGEQPGANTGAFDHQDELTAGAAAGGAEAAGDIVEADLGALDSAAGAIRAGAAVDGSDAADCGP